MPSFLGFESAWLWGKVLEWIPGELSSLAASDSLLRLYFIFNFFTSGLPSLNPLLQQYQFSPLDLSSHITLSLFLLTKRQTDPDQLSPTMSYAESVRASPSTPPNRNKPNSPYLSPATKKYVATPNLNKQGTAMKQQEQVCMRLLCVHM